MKEITESRHLIRYVSDEWSKQAIKIDSGAKNRISLLLKNGRAL